MDFCYVWVLERLEVRRSVAPGGLLGRWVDSFPEAVHHDGGAKEAGISPKPFTPGLCKVTGNLFWGRRQYPPEGPDSRLAFGETKDLGLETEVCVLGVGDRSLTRAGWEEKSIKAERKQRLQWEGGDGGRMQSEKEGAGFKGRGKKEGRREVVGSGTLEEGAKGGWRGTCPGRHRQPPVAR